MFKKFNTTSIIIVFFIIILAMLGFKVIAKNGQSKQAGEDKLKTVALLNVDDYQDGGATVIAVGQVESLDQVDLRSQLSAEVKGVNVKIGDKVRKGQLLVELDHSMLDAQLSQSSAAIEQMQSNLDLRVAGATDEQIAQAANAVKQAEAGLAQIKAGNERAVEAARLAMEMAESSLNNSGVSTGQAVNDAYVNLKSVSQSTLNSIYGSLTAMGNIYGEKPGDEDGDALFKTVLGVLNPAVKDNAKQKFLIARSTYETAKGNYSQLGQGSTSEEIIFVADKVKDSLLYTEEALSLTRTTLENSTTSNNFPASALSGLKAQVEMQITALGGAKANFEMRQQAATQTQLANNSSSDATSLAYEQARENYEQAKKTAEASLDLAEAGLAQAKAGYNALVADPRDVDLAGIRAGVKQSQAAYNLVASNRDKAFIRAPFEGTVAAVNVRAHDLANPGQVIVSMVNTEGLQLKSFISDKDRGLIEEGAKAVIEDSIEGVVSSISPSINSVTKKVEVIVAITSEDAVLTIGQYAEAKINIKEELVNNNIYFIPLKAVRTTPEGAYVFTVNEENKIARREIELGRVVDVSIEVTSGLENGMQIVESVRGLKEGEEVEIK